MVIRAVEGGWGEIEGVTRTCGNRRAQVSGLRPSRKSFLDGVIRDALELIWSSRSDTGLTTPVDARSGLSIGALGFVNAA